MQTWRWTELLQMLDVTSAGGHAGTQVLGEVCHRLVDVFLQQLFPEGLQSDFQLNLLVLWLQFSAWRPSHDSLVGPNLESAGHWFFSMNQGQFAFSQSLEDGSLWLVVITSSIFSNCVHPQVLHPYLSSKQVHRLLLKASRYGPAARPDNNKIGCHGNRGRMAIWPLDSAPPKTPL